MFVEHWRLEDGTHFNWMLLSCSLGSFDRPGNMMRLWAKPCGVPREIRRTAETTCWNRRYVWRCKLTCGKVLGSNRVRFQDLSSIWRIPAIASYPNSLPNWSRSPRHGMSCRPKLALLRRPAPAKRKVSRQVSLVFWCFFFFFFSKDQCLVKKRVDCEKNSLQISCCIDFIRLRCQLLNSSHGSLKPMTRQSIAKMIVELVVLITTTWRVILSKLTGVGWYTTVSIYMCNRFIVVQRVQ